TSVPDRAAARRHRLETRAAPATARQRRKPATESSRKSSLHGNGCAWPPSVSTETESAYRSLRMNVLLIVAFLAQDPTAGYVPLLQPDGMGGLSADSTAPQCVSNTAATLSIADCAGWVRMRTRLVQPYRLAFELRARDAMAQASLSLAAAPTTDGRPQSTAVVPLKPDAEWQEYIIDVDTTVRLQVNGAGAPFRSFGDPPVGSIA